MKGYIYKALRAGAEKKKAEALLTLKAFETNLSAIGDHSTDDLYNNLESALTSLVDAEDCLEMISRLEKDEI